jgi:hypothetical protein
MSKVHWATIVTVCLMVIGCKSEITSSPRVIFENKIYFSFVSEKGWFFKESQDVNTGKAFFFIASRSPYEESNAHYFDFRIYPPIAYEEGKDPAKFLCNFSDTKTIRKFEHPTEHYLVFEYHGSQCNRSRIYGIVKDNQIFRIIAGQDTRDYEALWNVLENLTFTD